MTLTEAKRLAEIGKALVGTGNSLLALAGNEIITIAGPYLKACADLTPEEIGLLKAGQFVECVKTYRARLDLGLKDAKDKVEGLAKLANLWPPK